MKIINIAIYVTAALLAVSVFLPITSLPVIGDVSYNRVADIDLDLADARSSDAVLDMGDRTGGPPFGEFRAH